MKITTNIPAKPYVTLELEPEEAQALRDIVGMVGGQGTAADFAHKLFDTLRETGFSERTNGSTGQVMFTGEKDGRMD